MRPLGTTQKAMLEALKTHGGWRTNRCGWLWSTPSKTLQLCESLVKRGLVTKRVVPGEGTIYEVTPNV